MCNSISIFADVSELVQQFQIDRLLSYHSNRYEINPTESVSAIVVKKTERILDEFRWGLIPFWAKDAVCGDSDAIFKNKVYQLIIKKQRCIIPCSGFYVSQTKGKNTQWLKFKMRSGTFGIAGLYDIWHSSSGEELRTCMMLMTEANSLVAPYHNRMPAILDQDDINHWLQPDIRDSNVLKSMLRPMDNLRMVSNLLASPKEKFETNRDISVLM